MDYIGEINKILSTKEKEEYISIQEIYEKLKKINEKQQQLRDKYVKKMNLKLQNTYNKEHYIDKKLQIIMCGFDYDKNELCILLKNTLGLFEKYYFSKINDEFKITESKNDLNRKKLLIIKEELQELYESYDEIKKIYKKHYDKIKIQNSNELLLDLNLNIMQLYIEEKQKRPLNIRMYTYSNDYFIDAPKETQEYIDENFETIINKTRIKKIDCPTWIK